MASSVNTHKSAKSKNSVTVKTVAPKKKTAAKSPNGAARSSAASKQKKPVTKTPKTTSTNKKRTKVVVKCNCGFSNSLYLRGEGIKGLSWEKGTLMNCTKADEWVWETDKSFSHAEIKVLLNDKEYELGENHDVTCGKSVRITPTFIS